MSQLIRCEPFRSAMMSSFSSLSSWLMLRWTTSQMMSRTMSLIMTTSRIPTMTKKLQKLLAKHRKANRARLTAYARRSRVLGGVCIQVEEFGKTSWKRVFRVPITDELKKELDANIERTRLAKLEVSKEIQEY